MSLSFNLLQSNGYFRKWEITFDGYFAFGEITSFSDLEKNKTAAKVTTFAAVKLIVMSLLPQIWKNVWGLKD